jgi:hypothetical protein
MSVEIQWTRPKLERLKEEYEKHKGMCSSSAMQST